MKTRTFASFLISLLLLVGAGGTQFTASADETPAEETGETQPIDDGFSFVYRGRIDPKRGSSLPETLDAVFSLYYEEQGSTEAWTATNTIMPSADGVFQCALSGAGLSGALSGGARFLGIALGGGEEQHPRQKLLDAPLADRAKVASRLLKDGTAITIDATNIVATAARFQDLRVNGPLTVGSDVALQIAKTKVSGTLVLKKGNATVSVFSNADPRKDSFDWLATTNLMFHTDFGGVVTILSDPGHWDDPGAAPCVTFPVPPGDVYPPFDLPHRATVYFYPFGTTN